MSTSGGSSGGTPTGTMILAATRGNAADPNFALLSSYITPKIEIPIVRGVNPTYVPISFQPFWLPAAATIALQAVAAVPSGTVKVTAVNTSLIMVKLSGAANVWMIADITADVTLANDGTTLSSPFAFNPANTGGDLGDSGSGASVGFSCNAASISVTAACLVAVTGQLSYTWAP